MFPTPIKHGALAQGSVVDALSVAASDAVTMPEFVPVINFSEFLLAVEQTAPKSPSVREEAEALSAKFAAAEQPSETLTDAEPALLRSTGVAAAIVPDPSRPALADASETLAVPDPVHETVMAASQVENVAAVTVEPARTHAAKARTVSARTAMRAARDDDDSPPVARRHSQRERSRAVGQFAPAMGLGASGIKVIIRPRNEAERSDRRPAKFERVSERAPSKPAAAVENDDQRGISGQAWEPLISSCAKSKRNCNGASVCGC